MTASGTGTAWGAVTVLNATATGIGCSLAIDAPTRATWTWSGEELAWQGKGDDRLVRAVWEIASQRFTPPAHGAIVTCTSPFPPSRGLKTSSAAALAMLRAACQAADAEAAPEDLDAWAVDASVAAKVTITGAYDDQVAVSRGGCHVTDNRARSVLASPRARGVVAVWVPGASIPKEQVAAIDPGPAVAGARRAAQMAMRGDIAGAMTQNGKAFLDLYLRAGLPVTAAPVETALAAGAAGAGLSGTGPAVAALFDEPTELPSVAGGTWHWHGVVP